MTPHNATPPQAYRKLVVLGALLLSIGVIAVAPVAMAKQQDEGSENSITFSVQPADGRGPDGRPNFSWGVTPGSKVKDNVAFVNYSRRPLPLSVYTTDAITTAEGGFGLLASGAEAVDLGSWIRLKGLGDEVVVPARDASGPGVIRASMVVRVPANASPGDHSAGVIGVVTAVDSDGGAQVRLEQRVASRVFARVSGDADPSLIITNHSTSYQESWNPVAPGATTVTYRVENDGNVNLSADQVVRSLGLFGDARVTPPDIELLLPGGSIDVSATVEGVWPQVWMQSQVELTPRDAMGETPLSYPVVSSTVSYWAIPWVWLAIMLGIALILFAWWRRRRAPRNQGVGSHTAPDLVGV